MCEQNWFNWVCYDGDTYNGLASDFLLRLKALMNTDEHRLQLLYHNYLFSLL